LVWGISRLVQIVQQASDIMGNKAMIALHIIDYILVIIVNTLQFEYTFRSLKVNELSSIAELLVYFFAL
jgi:hypothetical protein